MGKKIVGQEKRESEQSAKEERGIKELTDSLQRLQADFENYRKWVESKKADDERRGKIGLIRGLLPILDQMELALQSRESENFVKGVEMIFSEFKSVLQKEGLAEIESVGKKLDPFLHEVMLHEMCDKEEDTIIGELQKGYRVGDAVIRTSKVKVCKK
ncbi:nucleotide exchange factor GrpE [Candidatus Woesearchaeota archaeon]|nr:nucleotide exchange factor GrpE [Candidatus Woesearchaeota archaeon]